MKKTIINTILFFINIQVMISQTIVYQQDFKIDKDAWHDETVLDTSNYTTEELKEHKQNEEKMSKWINEMAEKESKERYYYTVGEEQIRYRRNLRKPGVFFDEEWILIDRNKRIMNHYYIDLKKGPQKNEFPFDRSTFRKIEVKYETKEHKDDRKTILGYDCYRVILTETIIDDEYGTEIKKYDMYVTAKINLPFHLLNTTLKRTIEFCPLQITTFRKDKGESFSTINAIQILEGSQSDLIELPERFKQIKPIDNK